MRFGAGWVSQLGEVCKEVGSERPLVAEIATMAGARANQRPASAVEIEELLRSIW